MLKSSFAMNLALCTGVIGMVVTLLFVGDMIFSISDFRLFGRLNQPSSPSIEDQLRQAGVTIERSKAFECKPRIQGKIFTLCSNANLLSN